MAVASLGNGVPSRSPRIASFGEVLFDIFDDGARLGGAPLNLAVHLHRLGAESLLISALGRDALGDAALQAAAGNRLAAEVASAPGAF